MCSALKNRRKKSVVDIVYYVYVLDMAIFCCVSYVGFMSDQDFNFIFLRQRLQILSVGVIGIIAYQV